MWCGPHHCLHTRYLTLINPKQLQQVFNHRIAFVWRKQNSPLSSIISINNVTIIMSLQLSIHFTGPNHGASECNKYYHLCHTTYFCFCLMADLVFHLSLSLWHAWAIMSYKYSMWQGSKYYGNGQFKLVWRGDIVIPS